MIVRPSRNDTDTAPAVAVAGLPREQPTRQRRLQEPLISFYRFTMEVRSLSTSAAASEDKNRTPASESPSSSTRYRGPLEQTIRDKLTAAFEPVVHLDVINESHMHNVPRNSETHFKVVVVSPDFDGMTIIQRHRKVNSVLADELQREGGIHALSIVAKTPAQWNEMVKSGTAVIEPSPNCRGGDGSLPSKG